MADQVALQTDIGSNALTVLGAAQPLLRALSADNINALAVLQAQSIGDCFHSNGEWAAKLPDLLARASSVRLERLSAWIGWQKEDTASHMRISSGGRTVSLICLALGNLYPRDRCGMILHGLSSRILAQDQQNASISQLSDLNACLSDKLSCLGFGNLLALHLTRIRQCFFEANCKIPLDLADIPTEETLQDFLVEMQKALQNEDLILHFHGSKGSGSLVALAMCLCPDDATVEVQGELIHQGQRSSVVFSIRELEDEGSGFHVESKLPTHSEHFQRRHIQVDESTESVTLRFRWSGWLSTCLEIGLVKVGASVQGDLQQALADLIAAAAYSLGGNTLYGLSSKNSGDPRLPKDGIRTLLGPEYNLKISKTLKVILTEPSTLNPKDLMSCFMRLKATVAEIVPSTSCTCGCCSTTNPWNEVDYPKSNTSRGRTWRSCRLARFWALLGDIVERGYVSLLVKVVENPSITHVQHWRGPSPDHSLPLIKAISQIVQMRGIPILRSSYFSLGVEYIHGALFSMVDTWKLHLYLEGQETPNLICQSSGHATIFPATLQYPRISYPWKVEYLLVDGKLHDGPNCYSAVICAKTQKGEAKKLKRQKVWMSLSPKNSQIVPSSLGAHDIFSMTLRPEVIARMQVLLLQSTIQLSTKNYPVNFLDIHLGFLSLAPADECEHFLRSPLEDELAEGVISTSVAAPTPKAEGVIALTLTHWNLESQFLSCSIGVPGLYQGECCLSCAVEQAREEDLSLIIGGNC